MHQRIEKLLGEAVGESHPVIAINVDVRDFSRFSLGVESVDTAIYIRKIYQRILSDYYRAADFFKLTGDGLLLVFKLRLGDDKDLSEKANAAIETGIRLVGDFGKLLKADPWIYFDVPKKVGIGVARGAASRLFVRNTTLDYSGATLNEASRLMDLARPQGLVVGDSFPFDILTPKLRRRFFRDDGVYMRSLAEKLPTTVRYVKAWTEIPARNRRPFDEVQWRDLKRKLTLREMMRTSYRFAFDVEAHILDQSEIWGIIDYPKADKSGRRLPGRVMELSLDADEWEYVEEAGQPRLMVYYPKLVKQLRARGVKLDWPLSLWIRYPT